MEKISWTAKVSNSEVLNRVKENRCIISTINQRKRRWLGHVLRHDVLLRDVLWLGNVREGERDYSWWATYARDTKQQRNELKTDVCDVSQWCESLSLTCYYSRIPEEDSPLHNCSSDVLSAATRRHPLIETGTSSALAWNSPMCSKHLRMTNIRNLLLSQGQLTQCILQILGR